MKIECPSCGGRDTVIFARYFISDKGFYRCFDCRCSFKVGEDGELIKITQKDSEGMFLPK